MLLVLSAMSALLGAGRAEAHSMNYAVYSKYEATVSDRRVVFVFAFDKKAVLSLLKSETDAGQIALTELSDHSDFFSHFLFNRFWVTNHRILCTHPARLGRFFWHEATRRVLAVTSFSCPQRIEEIGIRSLVTHDMPLRHQLVGDLMYESQLVRRYFYDDHVEAHISLSKLPETEPKTIRRRRGTLSSVAVPDRKRRYDELARAELGQDLPAARVEDAGDNRSFLGFVGEGIVHIFTGYDHVLFILTLMLAIATWGGLAWIVTSFTLAHSLTLALATLGLVSFPAVVVEPLIALSVLVVALDTLLRPHASARAAATFLFGLVHGFGLSEVLRELGLSSGELLPALLGFNLGVEFGQLMIVAPVFPLVLALRTRQQRYLRVRRGLSALVALLALYWTIDRVYEALVGA